MIGQWLLSKPIAHRGLHNDLLPENSLGAFRNAMEHGYPIELDVRLTDDDVLVVFHDDSLGRMTGKDGYLSKLDSASLSEYKLLGADKKPTEYSIPTFEEVLKVVDGTVPILVEIKNTGSAGMLEKKTAALLKGYKGECAVQSFDPYSLEYFKKNLPDIPRGILSCYFTKNELKSAIKRYVLKTLKMNKVASPDFISYCAENLPNKYVSATKLPVLAWTVRNSQTAERLCTVANNIIFEKFIPKEY